MTMREARLRAHLVQTFVHWFNEQYQRDFVVAPADGAQGALDRPLHVIEGTTEIAVHFASLYETEGAVASNGDLESIEDRLSEFVDGSNILWVPPGGRIPADEPAASDFVLRFESALNAVAPGEKGDLLLPATIYLTKIRDDGAYVSVMGGLSPFWTNISEHVRGAFILDSTQVRRPPRDESWLEALYERIGRDAAALALNETVSIETEQAWTLQRLSDSSGTVIVAAPTEVGTMEGVFVRRTLRRQVTQTNRAAAEDSTDLQALLLVGAYEYMDHEPATAALRGFDPGTYSNLDLIALAADGELKFVLPPRRLPRS